SHRETDAGRPCEHRRQQRRSAATHLGGDALVDAVARRSKERGAQARAHHGARAGRLANLTRSLPKLFSRRRVSRPAAFFHCPAHSEWLILQHGGTERAIAKRRCQLGTADHGVRYGAMIMDACMPAPIFYKREPRPKPYAELVMLGLAAIGIGI